jgi:predicted TIM-barrel fold metal-dependent hydrolase
MRRIRPILLTVFLLAALAVSLPQTQDRAVSARTPAAAMTPFIDVHAHLNGKDPEGSLRAAVAEMQAENALEVFFMPRPYLLHDPARYDYERIAAAGKKFPGKFRFLGGGGSLNGMIQEAVRTGDAGVEVRKRFQAKAEEIVRAGAVGFGEMSGEHLPEPAGYQHAPLDHPLYLLLSDIAAAHDMPIDVHMEAVTSDRPLPPEWAKMPSPPPVLHENIGGLERLLAHNPRTKILWAHAGWDSSGDRTPALMHRLLHDHPNLYMELKCAPDRLGKNTFLADGAHGLVKPEWLQLLEDYPDRFVMGADQPYPPPRVERQRWHCAVDLLNQLPADLRQKIAIDNVKHIYPRARWRHTRVSSCLARRYFL